jgi:hypothetical protein
MEDKKLELKSCEGCQFYHDWLFESNAGVPGVQKRCVNPYAGGDFWSDSEPDGDNYPVKELRSQKQVLMAIVQKQIESPLHVSCYPCPLAGREEETK